MYSYSYDMNDTMQVPADFNWSSLNTMGKTTEAELQQLLGQRAWPPGGHGVGLPTNMVSTPSLFHRWIAANDTVVVVLRFRYRLLSLAIPLPSPP